mmetsp:Transcript_2454/g.2547  ORF Transcript_2454/g.2547 Transcript_2454/m.2547 type:complete len:417 (+) Transcript_2454:57-1307(+)
MKFLLLILVIFQFVGKVEAIQLENNALERLAEKNRLADLHSAKISVEDFHVVTYLAPNGKRVEVRAISAVPTHEPTEAPSEEPSEEPTEEPTNVPSNRPSSRPSNFPSTIPSSRPSSQPSSRPSRRPSSQPTSQPTNSPTAPSFRPTFQPYAPSPVPTVRVTDNVNVTTEYQFGSVNAVQLNNVSVATITTVIQQVAPKPSTVIVQSFTRIDDGNGTRRRLEGDWSLSLTSAKVEIEAARRKYYRYRVVASIIFNLVNFPGQDASTVAASKTQLIKEVGTNGTFVRALRQLALANNATQLFNTTVEGVNVTHSVVPPTASDDDSSSHTARLTNGQIAGLIVGCVVGTGCLLTILYFFIVNKRANTKYDYIGNHYNDYAEKEFQGGYFDDTVTINVGGVGGSSTHQMAKHDEGEHSL